MTAPLDTADDPTATVRRTAHGSALDRLVRLQRLTARLAGTLEPATIAEVVVDHILLDLGASTAAMWLAEGDELVLLRANNLPNDVRSFMQRMKIAADYPLGDAVVTRTMILLRERAEFALRYPAAEARSQSLGVPLGAIVCLPLATAERALGALRYAFDDARSFDADDRSYFELVAINVVAALERARLFQAERAARERVQILYELAAAAANATSLDEIFEPALDSVCRAFQVERASILLFDGSENMRFRAWRGLSEEYRHAVDGHSPWNRDAVEPQPILVGDVAQDDAMKGYLPAFAKEGIGAMAFVPLVHDRRLIGKFMIYCDESRGFATDDVKLATAIATHIAQAIARSEAQDETKKARAAAEDAAKAHAEMVAVVAHDLRNPLGVAQLKAQLMMRKLPEDETGDKMRRDLEVIARNTQHMARLIGDLLDAATIEANRIAVERTPNVVLDIMTEALDLVRILAEQKHLSLILDASPPDLLASCDRARVLQVLSNLLGNGIKHSPNGGAVHVAAQAAGPEVLLSVSDQGPGIPVAERERVFERYVHGRQKGSVGLGLFIARGLVAAHGGRIWIEDASGATGTRVCFTLLGA